MKLVYSVKIKYEDKAITGLISPQLRIDFIKKYISFIDSTVEFSDSNKCIIAPERFELETLQVVMEEYVRNIVSNNYILRFPNSIQIEQKGGERWINAELSVLIEKSKIELLGEGVSILLFLMEVLLTEFTFALAARIDNIPYTTLIAPFIVNFVMAGIIYACSGATSNIVSVSKDLDNLIYFRKVFPEETKLEEKHSLCSSWNLAKVILCILPISCTAFTAFTYWQTIMALRDRFDESDSNDPILTQNFIYNVAIIGVMVNAMYAAVQYTSYSFRVIPNLKTFLDKCYSCIEKLSFVDEEPRETVMKGRIELNENDRLSITTPLYSTFTAEEKKNANDVVVNYVTCIYNNLLLNEPELLFEVKRVGDIEAVQKIINLGEDQEVANAIIEYMNQYGVKYVADILFNYNIKHCKIEDSFSGNKNLEVIEGKAIYLNSRLPNLLDMDDNIANKIIGQNFFLDNERGKEFILIVADNFDTKTTNIILALGRDKEIAEQIISEAETQGVNKVIYTLLGQKLPVIETTSIENIISKNELDQLRIVPNGILNSWSNKACQKIADYIDNLAKYLDEMLNIGKSGNQVAITMALLEELLGLAASGQKFVAAIPPYYDPNNYDWSGDSGGRGGYDGSNSTENLNGFIGLTLPLYNGTHYNITDYSS